MGGVGAIWHDRGMPLPQAEDIALVRDSFRRAARSPETFAAAYFRRLFELDRSLRRLFHGDMRQLGQKFVSTLGAFIEHLESFDDFAPHMRALGARHVRYRVSDEHYAVAASALVGTISAQLGEDVTPGECAAWTRVLGALTDEILAGARAAAHPSIPYTTAPAGAGPSRNTASTASSSAAAW